MSVRRITSREFNQDTGGAKKAAERGPVYITDRGRPSHVLLSFEDYLRLSGQQPSMIELLAPPAGVEDIELETPRARDAARPADLD